MPATATSWKREPFMLGVAFPYEATFSSDEMLQLREGLVPEVMEDKWFVYFEGPHLYFHRSWTGQPVYRLRFEDTPDGGRVAEALWSSDLAARPNPDFEYQAKLADFLISNLLLGQKKPFPRPQGTAEEAPGLIQHIVSGAGYPETPTDADHVSSHGTAQVPKKPWWRLW